MYDAIPVVVSAAAGAFIGYKLLPEMDHGGLWLSGILAEAALLGLASQSIFRNLAAHQLWGETLRWFALVLVALALIVPYARPDRVGAGDAQDYAEHIADFVAQARHGVFPILVGQSEFAFNGAFNPLRTAPYFQYLGGVLDVLTFRCLNAYAVQNLAIVLSFLAAGFSCYFCLRRIAFNRGWLCLVLALLYISSPGVLALVYDGDMIPSWLTLPYLPLYTYLLVRIADHGVSALRLGSMAIVMALVWLTHAPIAMWLSFIASPVIVLRLFATPGSTIRNKLLLGAASLLLFAALAGYEFTSVAELNLPRLPRMVANFRDPALLSVLRQGWAGLFHPVNGDGALLHDLQLSAPLWGCIVLGAIAIRRGGWSICVLLGASAILLLLLFPSPAVAGRLWSMAPGWVDQITDRWPMQRFYPILSAFAPFVGLLSLERISSRQSRLMPAVALGALAAGCCWSCFEARKFVDRGFRIAMPHELSRVRITQESAVLAIYSYGMLGEVPRYFSDGPTNADMQLQLLDRTSLELDQSNRQAVLDGKVGPTVKSVHHFVPVEQGAELKPALALAPGLSYLLKFDFERPPPSGTLVVQGADFFGEYPLPALGRPQAFGGGPGPYSNIALSRKGQEPEDVSVTFVGTAGSAQPSDLSDVEAIAYRPQDLPFHILDMIPLRVSISAAKEGWLETPRIFISGYSAKVDGRPAEIGRSSDGRVMVRVPSGDSLMELVYPGSILLRVSFWTSFCGWLALPLGWLAWHFSLAYRRARLLAMNEGMNETPIVQRPLAEQRQEV